VPRGIGRAQLQPLLGIRGGSRCALRGPRRPRRRLHCRPQR
jgi:hypothetical protein